MEIMIHASDISSATRPFKVVHEWTYLLFIEFFNQGDIEKRENLPVTFLCDRDSTNVAKAQPGFVNFVCLPIFENVGKIAPLFKEAIDQAKDNSKKWGEYEEID